MAAYFNICYGFPTVLEAYVNNRVDEAVISRDSIPFLLDHTELFFRTREACKEVERMFEQKYNKGLTSICEDFESIQKDSYTEVLENIVRTGVNWTRIVTIFAFAGNTAAAIALQGLPKEARQKIDLLIDWTSTFLQVKVAPWAEQNGGMEGFMKHFERTSKGKTQSWGRCFAGALGRAADFVVQYA